MEANELMIDNWVLTEIGPMQVFSISPNGCELILKNELGYTTGYSKMKPDLQPIPLTEDWLMKFGFSEIHRLLFTKNNVELVLEQYIFRYYYYGNSTWIDIKYVHQLQNLYFALTGTHLTLTPPEK